MSNTDGTRVTLNAGIFTVVTGYSLFWVSVFLKFLFFFLVRPSRMLPVTNCYVLSALRLNDKGRYALYACVGLHLLVCMPAEMWASLKRSSLGLSKERSNRGQGAGERKKTECETQKPLITLYRHHRNSSPSGCNGIQMRELYHFLTKWLQDGGQRYRPDFQKNWRESKNFILQGVLGRGAAAKQAVVCDCVGTEWLRTKSIIAFLWCSYCIVSNSKKTAQYRTYFPPRFCTGHCCTYRLHTVDPQLQS